MHRKKIAAQNFATHHLCCCAHSIYKDIFEDYKYLLNAFKKGADHNDYSREILQAESDIRKACNWLFPLPTNVIDEWAQNSFYAGTFDFRVFAREIEKQHGIGFADE